MAKKTAAWDILEKEYSPGQIRILRRVAKSGLRGATLVPSAEAVDANPETLAKIPLPD